MSDDISYVFDLGTDVLRVGTAGDDAPRANLSCRIGKPKYPVGMPGAVRPTPDYIRNLLEHGVVQDWDGMEALLKQAFYQGLGTEPTGNSILITEHHLNPTRNRERLLELLFETFESRSVLLQPPCLLQVYATGMLGGTSVSVGEGVTSIMQVIDGYVLTSDRIDLGGRDLTRYLATLLKERAQTRLDTSAELEIVRDIKENHSFVAEDYWAAMKYSEETSALEQTYLLPDGNRITVGSERFRCMEPLFDPSLLGIEAKGLHELILTNTAKVCKDFRGSMCGSIMLTGGCSRSPGFRKRLIKELNARLVGFSKARVCHPDPPRNEELVWQGGSIVASLSNSASKFADKQEYAEFGSSIVMRNRMGYHYP